VRAPLPCRHAALLKPYTSDVTQFIEQLKAQRPTLDKSSSAAARCCGTRRWTARREAWREARVPQKPYVYQTGN
jgi:hypothetical protein